ncbi:sugar ABC transporter permease [Niameybacter massiliensis]|uniref:Sugar ABC transporter permease n=1 Tax=Holtiella tumoricola TaxID=3018743 RepID=A0AA42DMY3_9FIRM|nr:MULTISPECIES: sugar ABC transporter permease [Lachnospirales]MDA3731766.1 sugar ABC transporter permease [Holtiella tumoricola]
MKVTEVQQTQCVYKRPSKKFNVDYIWGYLFIAPLVIGLGVFYIYPFIKSFFYSFTNINNFNQATFVGLENYKKLFGAPELWQATWNTLRYVIITVPIGIALSLIIAALLNTKIKGTSIYRTLYFLPAVTMPAAIAMVWKWIYNGNYGVLNQILGVLGIEGQNWLSSPDYALYMVMIVGIWSMIGYNMIILLAGMQGIPDTYYEAASIDGAGAFRKFFKITVPLLTPTIFFVLITGLISGFQVFDTIYMMIGKSSLAFESTQSLVMLFYRNAFDYGQKGYASAVAMFIFTIIMIITVIQVKLQKKWVNYD